MSKSLSQEVEKAPQAIEDLINPDMALEAAATLLLSRLTEQARNIYKETAEMTLRIPLWQEFCGMLEAAYHMGLHTSPLLQPEWVNDVGVQPLRHKGRECKQCGKEFKPRWPEEEFCSGVCGSHYQRDQLGGKRSHVVGGPYPLGEEPTGSVSSALRVSDAGAAD